MTIKHTPIHKDELDRFRQLAESHGFPTIPHAHAFYMEWGKVWTAVADRAMGRESAERRKARKRARKGRKQ